MQEAIPQVYKVDDLLAKQGAEGTERNMPAKANGQVVGDDKRMVGMPAEVELGDGDSVPLLFNPIEPHYLLKREKPEHRWICMLASKGYTTEEIAQETGFSPVTVNYVKRQPWAQEYIVKAMEKQGRKIVMSTLQGKALESAQTLIDTMQGNIADTKMATVRAKAANDILDRCFGTATNVTISGKVDVKDIPTDELAAIAMGRQN